MLKKLLAALVMVAATISISSCETIEYVYVQEPLPIPDRPNLPRIPSDQLQCLSDQAYEALVRRDAMQAAHIERLEEIMETTHADEE